MVSLFPHPASFRSRLTADTLAFGCILPTTGRMRDLHPLETCAARRTSRKRSPENRTPLIFIETVFIISCCDFSVKSARWEESSSPGC